MKFYINIVVSTKFTTFGAFVKCLYRFYPRDTKYFIDLELLVGCLIQNFQNTYSVTFFDFYIVSLYYWGESSNFLQGIKLFLKSAFSIYLGKISVYWR